MFRFTAEAWEWGGEATWVFLTLPHEVADEIEAGATAKGFGSVPVNVEVGSSSWQTSLFPDKKRASYVLPLKAAIRKAESIEIGDSVQVRIRPRA